MSTIDEFAKRKPSRPVLWTVIGASLGVVLLYAATRQVEPAMLVEMLLSIDAKWAAVVLALQITFIALKAWRWQLLLRFAPERRYGHLHSAVYAGLAVNYLVAHVGELLRAIIVARRECVPTSAVLASIFVERILDFTALLVIVAVVAISVPDASEVLILAGSVTAAVVVCAVVGLVLVLRAPPWFERLTTGIVRLLPRSAAQWCLGQLERFRLGLASIRDMWLMSLTLFVSVIQWGLVALLMFASGAAVGAPVTLTGATLTFLLIVLGLTLPNSPLQLGTTQLAFVIGMQVDGITSTVAVAASVVFMAFAIVPTMLIGGACVLRDRFGALKEARQI